MRYFIFLLIAVGLSGCGGPVARKPSVGASPRPSASPVSAALPAVPVHEPSPDSRPLVSPTVDTESLFQADLKAGIRAVGEGREAEAIPGLLRAKAARPEDPEANFWLFLAYSRTERPSKSAKACFFARKVSRLCAGSPMGDQADEYLAALDLGLDPRGTVVKPRDAAVAESVVMPPDHPVDPAYLASARQALDGLRSMKSVVRVGVSYADYPSRLQDARIIVDRFLDRHSVEQIPGLHGVIGSAMACFEDAGDLWAIKFEGDGVTNFVEGGHYVLDGLFSKYPRFRSDMNRAGARTEFGYHIDSGLPILWGYASDKVGAIERALSE